MPRRKKHPRFRGTLGTYKFRQALLGDPARHNRFSVLEAEATDDDSSTEPSSRMQDIEDSCGNRSTQDNSRRELVTINHYKTGHPAIMPSVLSILSFLCPNLAKSILVDLDVVFVSEIGTAVMEDVGNMNPLLRTLLEMVSEEQISEIPRHGLENLLLEWVFISLKRITFSMELSLLSIKKDTKLLSRILLRLSEIWSQPEWETNLLDFFNNAQFRTSVYNVVAFFENELTMCTAENYDGINHERKLNYSTLTTLIPLLFPLLLELLQYVHSLWTDEVASNISEELEGAKCIICSEKLCGIVEETTEIQDMNEEELLVDEIREWLEKIRQTGYNVIGMCASLEGAFCKLLDSFSVCGTLLKDVESMDFRHLTMLIKYTIVPLVKSCPPDLWVEWIDMLLPPVFHYCEETLYSSWCSLLYKDIVSVPDKFCESFSKEMVENAGKGLLSELTREASYLLAAMALPEQNGSIVSTADLESTSSSLVGYLLCHDNIRSSILRLINYIFGYWKDGEARIIAAPFCHSLIQLAIATHNDELLYFVQDDILPKIVQCLTLEPKSDNNALYLLCEDAYHCMQSQGSAQEGECNGNTAEIFEDWLSKQMIVARYKYTSSDELQDMVWIWEIEEEFIAYLHTYVDMLHKVDEIGDTMEDCYLSSPIKFVSKHDTDCCAISHAWAMSTMLSCSGYDESVQELVEDDSEVWSALPGFCRQETLELFCRILDSWEPQFHPLIRQDDKEMLREIACLLTSREDIHHVQSFQPVSSDFLLHLQPYAQNYIEVKNASLVTVLVLKVLFLHQYDRVKEQTRLHEAFDIHLASGALDDFVRRTSSSKDDFINIILDDDILRSQFTDLDYDLLKLSYEHRDRLESLICELEAEGFFSVDDDSIEWENEHFSELVDEFNEHVFAGIHLPKYYVIRGIMVVDGAFCRWMEDRDLFWMETRYYSHCYYDIIQEPVKMLPRHTQPIIGEDLAAWHLPSAAIELMSRSNARLSKRHGVADAAEFLSSHSLKAKRFGDWTLTRHKAMGKHFEINDPCIVWNFQVKSSLGQLTTIYLLLSLSFCNVEPKN
uniref:Exportin-5 C-terminal domain-containing protein n=1 Tax=Oryza barthii TaxID=65489 RepID=A0A0D3HM88_9ORYZ